MDLSGFLYNEKVTIQCATVGHGIISPRFHEDEDGNAFSDCKVRTLPGNGFYIISLSHTTIFWRHKCPKYNGFSKTTTVHWTILDMLHQGSHVDLSISHFRNPYRGIYRNLWENIIHVLYSISYDTIRRMFENRVHSMWWFAPWTFSVIIHCANYFW
jgi:hypothetical protein